MNEKSVRLFLLTFLSITIPVLIGLAALNYWMDPYDYFGTSKIPGYNEYKLGDMINTSHERFDRALAVMRRKPKAIMLGTSRIKTGFESSYFSRLLGTDSYKVAFSGARFDELYAYFEHALFHQPDLKHVFLGIDFYSFSDKVKFTSDFSAERLARSTLPLNDILGLLLSYGTLKFSHETYELNLNPKGIEHTNRNHVKIDDNEYMGINTTMLDNPDIFIKSEKMITFDDYAIDQNKIELFRKLVQKCQDKNIDLKIIFCPSHCRYWEAIAQCGRQEDFENLKRQLTAIHPIYDFSGFTKLNNEPLTGEHGEYYFEISHFKPTLGRLILDKVYGVSDQLPDTGYLVTKDNIEEHLKRHREEREEWAKNNTEQAAWVKEQLESEY